MSSSTPSVDPRGLRFGATITSLVLVGTIIAPAGVREVLLALQVAAFAIGAFIGPAATPQSKLFAKAVRPRIGAPKELEDARPPQFAQAVGLAFTLPALAFFLAGFTTVGLVLVGLALTAALLNAATGFCLGCEMYLVTRRLAKQLV